MYYLAALWVGSLDWFLLYGSHEDGIMVFSCWVLMERLWGMTASQLIVSRIQFLEVAVPCLIAGCHLGAHLST